MRNCPTSVMLFAAGRGTRMGTLTADRPKPMIPVAGQPLIDHALAQIDGAGVSRAVINLHYKAPMLVDHLKHRDVLFSDETEMLLETGGGLKRALPLLDDGPVFTLNGDAVWGSQTSALTQLRDAWNPDQMDALLLLVPPERAHGHTGVGDFLVDSEGRLNRGPDQIYTGAQIIKTDRLAGIGDEVFSLNRLWDLMLGDDTLFGCTYDGHWCDVGQPDGIGIAEKMLADQHV